MKFPPAHRTVVAAAALAVVVSCAVVLWWIAGPAQHSALARWLTEEKEPGKSATETPLPDARLVRLILDQRLANREFAFATIAEACSGKIVIPLGDRESHRRVKAAIEAALTRAIAKLNASDSPVRALRRINEASRFFEDALHKTLNGEPDLSCDVPPNRRGDAQRSGYPDLRIVHQPSGDVFYLDPKLVEDSAWNSTLRTFYFEPKDETLKITDDAVHLLAGISHDGKDGGWTFTGFKLVDLSGLKVRLKAEFQASNRELYPGGR